MKAIKNFLSGLLLILNLILFQSCNPMVSDGMIEEQASIPRQLLVLDQIQMTPETSSTHPPITIRVLDFQGAPLPNAKISLLTTSGYATSSSMYTNAQGEVEIYWNFGNQIGVQILKVIADLNGNILQRDIGVYLVQSTASAIESTISGTTLIAADGYSLSTVTITLKTSSGIGIAGEIPTFTATDTDSKNIYTSCSPTDDGGVSSCAFASRAAEVKTLQLETPVSLTGGTVEFIDPSPAYDIVFTTQPVAATTDDEFTTQPVVQALDQSGQPNTTNSTSVIVLTPYDGLNCSGPVVPTGLGGSTSVSLSNGTATFTNVLPKKTTIRSLLATTGSLSKCSNNFTVSPGAPNKIAISSGNNQTKQVTEDLDPFVVIVRDFNDNIVPSASVAWTQISGSGTLSAASTTTNSSGEATSTLTLSNTVESYEIEASILSGSVSVTFEADSTPGNPASLTIISGNGQTGTVGAPVVTELEVLVKDAYSNPIEGVDINWLVLSGSGSLINPTMTTDPNGVAKTGYSLGTTASLNEISATFSGPPLLTDTFSLTGVADAPDTISLSAGDVQSVNYGTNLSSAMEVLVQDQYFNPVENATINWTTTNSGTLTSPQTITSATGLGSNGIMLSTTAGPFTVTATLANASASVPSYIFNHTATVPPPTNLAGVDGVGTVDLTWDAVTAADSYKIFTASTQGGPYTEIATSATNSYNSLAITGTTYIVVRAVQTTYDSADSNEISAPTLSSWLTQIGVTNGGSTTLNLSSAGDDFCKNSVKSGGFLYCAGSTTGSLKEPNGGGKDGVIVKFDSQGSVVWIHQLGAITKHPTGTNSGNEECTSLAVSNDGLSIYCAGNTSGSMSETNGGGKDAFVAKIFHDGTLTWLVQLGQTNGAGFSKGDSSGDDICESLTLDSFNNAYCAGSTTSTVSGDQDAFVAKIDSITGALSWLTQINSTTNPSGLVHTLDESCLALASNGTEVYCAGATKGNLGITPRVGSDNDVFHAAFDTTTGAINWITQTYSASGDDYCLSLFYESTLIPNQLFCGGKTTGSFAEANAGAVAGSTDAFVMSLNPVSGLSNWGTQLGDTTGALDPSSHTGNDSFLSITSDGVKIYAGGETDGFMSEPNAGEMDAFISVFTVGGNYLSTKQFGAASLPGLSGDGAGTESCSGIEILNDAGDDKLYCIGSTTSNFAETTGGLSDIFYVILNLTTPSTSLNQIGGTYGVSSSINKAALNDVCKAMTQDSAGNLYCAGHTYGSLGETNAGGADAFMMKLNKNGQVQWISQLGVETLTNIGDGSGDDFCTGIALDSAGNIYCGGYTNGNLIENNAGSNDVFIAKFDSSGTISWINHLGYITSFTGGDNSGDDKCHALAINTSNNEIYCAGETQSLGEANAGGSDAVVMKFDADGTPAWAYQLGSAASVSAPSPDKTQDDKFSAISIDSVGGIYAAGITYGNLFVNQLGFGDAFIIKLDGGGVRQWGTQIGGTGRDWCQSLVVEPINAQVYCGGETKSTLNPLVSLAGSADAFVAKIDMNSGFNNWMMQLGAGNEFPTRSHSGEESCQSLDTDSAGNIYCAGETTGSMGDTNAGGSDVFIAKIDSDGEPLDIFQVGQNTITSGSGAEDETCHSFILTNASEMICGGSTKGSLTDSNGFGSDGQTSDIMIFKLNATGSFL